MTELDELAEKNEIETERYLRENGVLIEAGLKD